MIGERPENRRGFGEYKCAACGERVVRHAFDSLIEHCIDRHAQHVSAYCHSCFILLPGTNDPGELKHDPGCVMAVLMGLDCFDAVGDFHRKFGLQAVSRDERDASPRLLDAAELRFRSGFMSEELVEFMNAASAKDLLGMADALVDLVYVAMGTAHLMGLPWRALWTEVQRANMSKIRCGVDHYYMPPLVSSPMDDACAYEGATEFEGESRPCGLPEAAHSKRGSALDVIKPPGFAPPDIRGVLDRCVCRICGDRHPGFACGTPA